MQVKVTNQYGQYTTYTLNGAGVALVNVAGLNPPNARISSSTIATKDGSIVTNEQANNRNIVLTFAITGRDAERQRTGLYYYFKIKEPVSLEIKTATRTATIDGYVESIQANPFDRKQQIQISIICPNPYFLGSEETTNVSYPSGNVVTLSDTSHGAVFTVTCLDAITGGFVIGNTLTGESFCVNGDYVSGDVVTIDTRQGQKGITLTHNGSTSNILSRMNSTVHDWLQLLPWQNNGITLSTNKISAVVRFQTHYEGV
ncbi:MAG: phage tail family protein [Alphaproteobacteria bacterium]|nr:phage tail family protein [Alphaproteobacteria bacterium]